MVRLPDIPVQEWATHQIERFHSATDGLFESVEAEELGRSMVDLIPKDFPLPGGPDQWDQASQQWQEEQERRAQEEEELRRQQQEAEQQRIAQEIAQRREREVLQSSLDMGIPTPGSVFESFEQASQRQPDNTSTTGIFDARAVDEGPREVPTSPEDQFMSWARDLTEPVLGPTTPDIVTPEPEPEPDNTSTTGIFDQAASFVGSLPGRASEDLGRLASRFAPKKGLTEGLTEAVDRMPGIPEGGSVFQGDYWPEAAPPTDEGSRLLRESGQSVMDGIRTTITDSLERMGINPDAALQAAQDVSGLLGPGGAALGIVRSAGDDIPRDAINVIKTMRSAGFADDLVLQAERHLSETTRATLDEIQALTRGAAGVVGETAEIWAPPRQYREPTRPGAPPAAPSAVSAAPPVTTPPSTARPGLPALPTKVTDVLADATPEGTSAALADHARIRIARERANKGISTRAPDQNDVDRIIGLGTGFRERVDDRHAKIGALQSFIERTRGATLTAGEKAWTLARLYAGRGDRALHRLQSTVQERYTAVPKDVLHEVDDVMEQLDNVNVDHIIRTEEQNRVLQQVKPGRAPITEVRREGEAVLESQRARASLQAAEREWVQAQNARDNLLREMERAGEGPTRGTAPETRAKVPVERPMETERSMSAQERLERLNLRVLTAEARRDDARRVIRENVGASRARNETSTMERAAVRAETVASERKYSGGATPQETAAIWAALVKRVGPENAQKVRDAVESFYDVRDQVRDRLVATGVWSPEVAQFYKEQFPYYSPTRILHYFDANYLSNASLSARTFSTAASGIKKLGTAGTTAERQAPTQAIVQMVFQGEDLASRNAVMKAVAGWAERDDMSPFFRRLQGEQPVPDPQHWVEMSARVDGKVQRLAVRKDLQTALEIGDPSIAGEIGIALSALRMPLQAGATALRPAFIATNAVNDAILTQFRFASETNPLRHPIEAAKIVAGTDLINGYMASFGMAKPATRAAVGAVTSAGTEATVADPDDPNYWYKIGLAFGAGAVGGLSVRATKGQREMVGRMRAAGGSIGTQSRWDAPADITRQLRGEGFVVRTLNNDGDLKGFMKNMGAMLSDVGGLLWARPLAEVSNIVERAPRYAAFGRAERLGKTADEAAMAARRVTADFDAGGTFMKKANQLIPFLNASTQATSEGLVMAHNNPVKFAALMSVIVGTIVETEIYNRAVAPEDYKDVSQFTRDTGLVVLSDQPAEGKGKRGLLYIPLRGIVGSLVPLTRTLMDLTYGDDPRTWQQLARETGMATIQQMSPVNVDSGLLTSPLPALATGIQAVANYDAFRDQPIVPKSMEGLPVTEQYTDRTSMAARHLSRTGIPGVGSVSPMKLDWVARSFSPGPGEAVLAVADYLIHKSGGDLPTTVKDVPKGARDVPMVGTISGRFLRTVGSERQNRAYELADDIMARHEAPLVAQLEQTPDYQNATPDRQKQMLRSLQDAIQKRAEILAGVPEYKQPKDLGLPPRFMGVTPGSALEAEIGSALATAEGKRTSRQRALVSQYRNRLNPRWTAAHARQTDTSDDVRGMVNAGVQR